MQSRASKWSIVAWSLLVLSAMTFHWTAMVMHNITGSAPESVRAFLPVVSAVHQAVSGWVYLIPVFAAPLAFGCRMPRSLQPAPEAVLGIAFLLSTVLWVMAMLGVLLPLATHSATL